ncbi:Hypothetical predicted protein [Podarcis lilfordi]|uniref:Uncharacterized protein n=1 Tax=Podarcis lilfordi TaxID=74358 RepID=A0AA35NZN3_9SAUR|nr:Hypothetical predicted protein [Podarcis lilfordi]
MKEKHRGKQLKEKATRKEVREKNSKVEEECIAFLDHSESDEDFDLSMLPDLDRYTDSDQEADPESHGGCGKNKQPSGGGASAVETAPRRNKIKLSKEDSFATLGTGFSLVEDEALVLHLLNNQS